MAYLLRARCNNRNRQTSAREGTCHSTPQGDTLRHNIACSSGDVWVMQTASPPRAINKTMFRLVSLRGSRARADRRPFGGRFDQSGRGGGDAANDLGHVVRVRMNAVGLVQRRNRAGREDRHSQRHRPRPRAGRDRGPRRPLRLRQDQPADARLRPGAADSRHHPRRWPGDRHPRRRRSGPLPPRSCRDRLPELPPGADDDRSGKCGTAAGAGWYRPCL